MGILTMYSIAFIASLYSSFLKKRLLIVPILFLFLFLTALTFYLIYGKLNFLVWSTIWLPAILALKEYQKYHLNKITEKGRSGSAEKI